jgi:ABC-type phosphate transport system permease subunit
VVATTMPNAPEDMQWGTALVLLILVMIFAATGSIIRARARLHRRE